MVTERCHADVSECVRAPNVRLCTGMKQQWLKVQSYVIHMIFMVMPVACIVYVGSCEYYLHVRDR